MKKQLEGLILDEQGQDLIEYALLAGFMSLAVVSAVTTVATSLNAFYGKVETQVDAAAS
jgi:pilus assembly protein Flp/PilA